ncbi:hypothetical protein A6R68_03816 [Neotoma lepida]|uniref:Uncharacterized protein n=1 Tax=Neotoma lepida TaxID=56216 RepID=A0A1A6GPM9_NEOLE|nr:hypothetical protein A6R68_03816 [Neotoma lepida]
MSADLTEVNGALTPAGRFGATPTPPPGEQQGQRQAGDSPCGTVTARGRGMLRSRGLPRREPIAEGTGAAGDLACTRGRQGHLGEQRPGNTDPTPLGPPESPKPVGNLSNMER